MRPLIANIVNAIRTTGSSRAATVGEMRAETRSALLRHRSLRAAAAVAFRQALRRHRATVLASVRAVFTGAEPPAPTGGHTDGHDAKSAAAEHTSVWEVWPDPPGRQDATRELLQTLRVIQNHPEGICARDIGNELGIDWRQVPALTRCLLEAGVIEQVEQDFYPRAKAANR